MDNNITIEKYVAERIEQIFHDVAEKAGQIVETEDEGRGLPLFVFAAQTAMLNFWRAYVHQGPR